MGTGPPPGGTVPAVWERAGRMTKVTFAGTAAFGARASAEGRPLWDEKRKHSESGCGTRFAGCGSVQGNGWSWRHFQGIRQPTAGAHDIG